MNKKILRIMYFGICTVIALSKECYGYLDPSAMTYVIQIIAAVGITVATSIGIIFYKIKRFFKTKRNNKNIEKENESEI